MRLRAPANPLVTVDPYFSIWSPADHLYDTDTVHWTGKPMILTGVATVDGVSYRFMGRSHTADGSELPAMRQTALDIHALQTDYTFEGGNVELLVTFTSSQLPNDLNRLTRPVTFLSVSHRSLDGAPHTVSVRIAASEQVCLHEAGQDAVVTEALTVPIPIALGEETETYTAPAVRMGSKSQPILRREGDDVRIDWGYFYLTVDNDGEIGSVGSEQIGGMTYVYAEATLEETAIFALAYDDIRSIKYYGEDLPSFWNRDGKTILEAITEAYADYDELIMDAVDFDDTLFLNAVRAGGEDYAEILTLAYRQVVGAHKLAVKRGGELVYISKECFSNGCAATVDVSYPSIPLFLVYNPELVQAMMRPIYDYALSGKWKYDFAPHDAGRYPIVDGQRYGGIFEDGHRIPDRFLDEKQMPVEECGNMILMEAAAAVALDDVSFAVSHMDILEKWVQYLIENGRDPEHQLCTDDFAGHLAHNVNLSLKAIMGLGAYAILLDMQGMDQKAQEYLALAREMAADVAERAKNGDGSYRLAFDRADSFSMKYNAVWDLLFGTKIFPSDMLATEFLSYRRRMQTFGLPLDSRRNYTKSDWLVWTATLAPDRRSFDEMIHPLWLAYHTCPGRVPLSDWYDTDTGDHHKYGKDRSISMRNRTVQGGLFMKLLQYMGIMRYEF